MRVRPATPADAGAIHRVSVASCRAAYADILDDPAFIEMVEDPSRVERLRERLADAASTEEVVYLVAERDETVVGFLQVLYGDSRPEHVEAGVAYLKSLYVHPDSWNEGVGSALLAAGLDRVPPSVDRVQLGVLSANETGKRFYEKRGFERVGAGTFEVDGSVYDTDVYARDL